MEHENALRIYVNNQSPNDLWNWVGQKLHHTYVRPSEPMSGLVDHPVECPLQTQGSEIHPGEMLEAHTTLMSEVWKFS